MDAGNSWRKLQVAVVVVGMVMQSSPMAWAQLETVDPALHAAVEALVAADPEVANNPELAQICRDVAEATVLDPRERAAVTSEVIVLQREGVDLSTVIPKEVREAAREQFTKVQGEMREQLEKLRAADPEKAKEMELTMREGERCMLAFESGERYVPSTEMVAHAQEMFGEWEKDMLTQGAPPEFVERAKLEFAMWSGGEPMQMGFGGPGHEFAGLAGHMPSVEQMQAMGMTAEQIQMAQTYPAGDIGMSAGSSHMPSVEQMQGMGMTAEQIQMAETYASGGGHIEQWSNSTDLRTDLQSTTTTASQERHETVGHLHGDGSTHSHDVHVHTDGTRHDHTATSPADTAPGAVYQ